MEERPISNHTSGSNDLYVGAFARAKGKISVETGAVFKTVFTSEKGNIRANMSSFAHTVSDSKDQSELRFLRMASGL